MTGHGHVHGHHHHHAHERVDAALEGSAQGLRTLWFSFGVLAATTAVQAVIAAASGSVALLGDTVHNAADALTALPLALAFVLGRRAATRRYTYGFGRAEDLAGVFVVLVIAASAVFAGYEALRRLFEPQEVSHLAAVAAAGLVGFAGNEWVAAARIRTGRRIGSAALVADGLHARSDGFTSLAVLLGAGGAALGWRWADPLIGLAITGAIALVLRGAAREIWQPADGRGGPGAGRPGRARALSCRGRTGRGGRTNALARARSAGRDVDRGRPRADGGAGARRGAGRGTRAAAPGPPADRGHRPDPSLTPPRPPSAERVLRRSRAAPVWQGHARFDPARRTGPVQTASRQPPLRTRTKEKPP